MASHEGLYELEQRLGCNVRFAWAMLLTLCDREGRFNWRPKSLKLGTLPYDDCDFSRVLDAWLSHAMLVKYHVGDQWYGVIPTFRKHQFINNKEAASEIPSVEEADEVIDNRNQAVIDTSATRQPREDHAIGTPLEQDQGERKGTERKGKEKEHTSEQSSNGEREPPEGAVIHEFKSGRWFWGTDEDLDIATHIADCILKKFPETKAPNMAVWSNDVRLMRTADDRDPDHIRALFDWAHADEGDGGKWPGWSVNVRSPDKLRAKWSDLAIRRNEQIERGKNGRQTGKRKSAFERLEDDLARDGNAATAGRTIDLREGADGFSVERNDRPIRGIVDG